MQQNPRIKRLNTYDLHVITEDIFWYEFLICYLLACFVAVIVNVEKKKRGEGLVKAYEGRGSAS